MGASGLETGIRFFAVELHTHLTGVAVRVHHMRNSTLTSTIARDDHFDFNFQEMRQLKREFLVQPVSSAFSYVWF